MAKARQRNDLKTRFAQALAIKSPWPGRAGTAIFIVVLVGAVLVGVGPMKDRVGDLRADPLDVVFAWPALAGASLAAPDAPTTWMPEDERWRLEQIVRISVSLDPFDSDSLQLAQQELAATGWFAHGPIVRRRAHGLIEVTGPWRGPAAVVRTGSQDLLISADARLLPITYRAGAAGTLPVILGVWGGPPANAENAPAHGARWIGDDLAAALRLLGALRTSAAFDKVQAIDAEDFDREQRLTIITTHGARVVWGHPPGTEADGEPTDDVKLARFESLLSDVGWIHAGRPLARLYTPYVLIDETARAADP